MTETRTTFAIRTALRFNSLANATSAACHGRGNGIILGYDAKFWVVSLADMQRLERAGYTSISF